MAKAKTKKTATPAEVTNLKKTQLLFKKLMMQWAPPPALSVSQWADEYRRLSPEASSTPGKWSTNVVPFMRDVMDAFSDPATERIVVMASAQIAKTESMLNMLGYVIHLDPGPAMYVMPTIDVSETFGSDRLEPMIRDTAVLTERVSDKKSRDSGNTKTYKRFRGGYLTLVGTNSPSDLASRPIRYLFLDEVDRYPVSSGREGDPVNIVVERTKTFHNRKIVMASTPTDKDASRIESAYLEGTQERWYIPCPECGAYVTPEFNLLKFKYDDDKNIVGCEGMICPECGCISSEAAWKRLVGNGVWKADKPERGKKVRSFRVNEIVSPFTTWDAIVTSFWAAHSDREQLKAWHNLVMGEPFVTDADTQDLDIKLMQRREMYNCMVPDKVVVLTMAVDVQDNRLEYEVCGWGLGYESWGIQYGVLMGDPGILTRSDGQPTVWQQMQQVLDQAYIRSDGSEMHIQTCVVDSGGHHTDTVYKVCRQLEHRRVWAIKGRGGAGYEFIQRPKHRNDAGIYLFLIGVDSGKDMLMSRLKTEAIGSNYCHFPMEPDRGYDEAYFRALTAEHKQIRYTRGVASYIWVKRSGAANEAWDLRNYNQAALAILGTRLEALAEQFASSKPAASSNPQPQATSSQKKRLGTIAGPPTRRRVVKSTSVGGVTW